jgi:hypothetical protein
LLNHAARLAKKETPFNTLELHHTLVGEAGYRFAVPIDWFWMQTEPLQANSTPWKLEGLLRLTPAAQLLYACAHAMLQHGGRDVSLRWLYDLDRLERVHAERLDWELLLSQAKIFEWPATHTLEEYQRLKSLNTVSRLKVLCALIVPAPAYMRWRYGLRTLWVLPIWYLYRWWGIFVDGARTAWHLIQKAVTNRRLACQMEQ